MSDSPSPIAPRPRPGYRSVSAISMNDKAALVASSLRAILGVVCLGAAVLYLPTQMVTPILSGVSVLMIVTGAFSSWKAGRRERRLMPYARMIYWGCPALGVIVFVAMLAFGPGFLGPTWEELAGVRQEPATFVPPEELPKQGE